MTRACYTHSTLSIGAGSVSARGNPHRWQLLSACGCLAVLLLAVGASGQDAAAQPHVVEVRAGLGGRYKAGCWTPLSVTLDAGKEAVAGRLTLETNDGDGSPYRIGQLESGSTRLPADDRRNVMIYFRPGALENEVSLFWEPAATSASAGGKSGELRLGTHALPRALPTAERLLVSIGPPLGLADAFRAAFQSSVLATHVVELDDFNQLPERWYGYDSADVIVLNTSSAAFNERWTKDKPRFAALRDWVKQGGRLIFCASRESGVLFGGEHPLGGLVRARYLGMAELFAGSVLEWEKYADADIALAERLAVPRMEGFAGRVELPSPDTPLIVRSPLGFGEVVFVAADLDQVPFARWSGRSNLIRRLIDGRVRVGLQPPEATATVAAPREDLSDQVMRALDDFPGVNLVPFLWVAGMVLAYIALIGPGDFFFIKRWLKRQELTWLTFPALVVLSTVGVYRLSHWLKGSERRINQLDVIDIDVASGLTRGTTLANVFSPRTETFDLAARPGVARPASFVDDSTLVGAFGLPDAAIQAGAGRSTALPLANAAYRIPAGLDRFEALPVQIWSSKAIEARWTGHASGVMRGELTRTPQDIPQGRIEWLADLALDDCWLIYGNGVTPLGTLRKGEPMEVGPFVGAGWSTLASQLRRQRREAKAPGREEYAIVGTAWDDESKVVPDIVREIMFYQAAGGREYTRMTNAVLRRWDFSSTLDLGNAMLVGHASNSTGRTSAGADLLRGSRVFTGQSDRRWIVLRCLLHVNESTNE